MMDLRMAEQLVDQLVVMKVGMLEKSMVEMKAGMMVDLMVDNWVRKKVEM